MSVASSAFTLLCCHHHHPSQNSLHLTQLKLPTRKAHSPLPLPQALVTTILRCDSEFDYAPPGSEITHLLHVASDSVHLG